MEKWCCGATLGTPTFLSGTTGLIGHWAGRVSDPDRSESHGPCQFGAWTCSWIQPGPEMGYQSSLWKHGREWQNSHLIHKNNSSH